jgi:isoleucyl-tRNA synthetase
LLAFTTEEVWSYTRKPAGAPDSVHLALLPEPEELASGLDAAKLARWERLLEVRSVVLKALEEARQLKVIGTSLEARVRLAGAHLDDYAADLPALFITSQVVLEPGDDLKVTVEGAEGAKCDRCWKYSVFTGPACEPCSAALKEILA